MTEAYVFINIVEFAGIGLILIIALAVISLWIFDKWFKTYYCHNCHKIITEFNKNRD